MIVLSACVMDSLTIQKREINMLISIISSLLLDQNVTPLQLFPTLIQIVQKQSSDTRDSFWPPVPQPTENLNGIPLPFFGSLAARHSFAHRASKCVVCSPFLLNSFSPFEPVPCLVRWHIFRGVFPETRLLCCSAQDFNATLDHSYQCYFKTYTPEPRAGFTYAYSHGRRNGISMLSLFSLYPKHKAWRGQVIHSFIINLVDLQIQYPSIHSTSINQDKG